MARTNPSSTAALETVTLSLAALKPHPRNYRDHPDDQIEHLMESIREHDFYRNIVVAEDDTILAGHGVVIAAMRLGRDTAPGVRLPISPDDPRALKVLAGDNEIGHLIEVDDRALSELLKEIRDADLEHGLLGTGYDEMMLANLLMTTGSGGPQTDAWAEWQGMPEFAQEDKRAFHTVLVHFDSLEDVHAFGLVVGQALSDKTKFMWFPKKDRASLVNTVFSE